jgi:hypothetical protein
MLEVAKQLVAIYQSIATSGLVGHGQLFGRTRPVVWLIAAAFGLYQTLFSRSV